MEDTRKRYLLSKIVYLRVRDWTSGQSLSEQSLQIFWHQSEVRTAATAWNWSGKTLSPGALLAVLYFSFFRPFRLSLVPTICPWVSEDDVRTYVRVYRLVYGWGRGDYQKEGRGVLASPLL